VRRRLTLTPSLLRLIRPKARPVCSSRLQARGGLRHSARRFRRRPTPPAKHTTRRAPASPAAGHHRCPAAPTGRGRTRSARAAARSTRAPFASRGGDLNLAHDALRETKGRHDLRQHEALLARLHYRRVHTLWRTRLFVVQGGGVEGAVVICSGGTLNWASGSGSSLGWNSRCIRRALSGRLITWWPNPAGLGSAGMTGCRSR
jgi:hypothetical protein